MNPIRSTASFEHEIPGADILLLIIICSKCITFRAELVLTFARAGVRYVDSNFPVEKLGTTGVISLDMSKKSQVVRVRSPRFLEHNFLRAVGRTEISEIEGSCKVYGRKTNWKTN